MKMRAIKVYWVCARYRFGLCLVITRKIIPKLSVLPTHSDVRIKRRKREYKVVYVLCETGAGVLPDESKRPGRAGVSVVSNKGRTGHQQRQLHCNPNSGLTRTVGARGINGGL